MEEASDPNGVAAQTPDLRDELVRLEYTYLTESSFRSDELRDRIFQFYLVIVSTAAAAILGLSQLASSNSTFSVFDEPTFRLAFAMLAILIGVIGLVMLPIFVRLRRVVMECLQGTVLIKRYVMNTVGERRFGDAFIWDDRTLPHDESYGSASFLLVFVFILLDSVMLTLPVYLFVSDWLRAIPSLVWTLVFFVPVLTAQVMWYRYSLWKELSQALERNRFTAKWVRLGLEDPVELQPRLREPLLRAFVVGAGTSAVLLIVGLLLEFGVLRA
jgi:hypothetical protein